MTPQERLANKARIEELRSRAKSPELQHEKLLFNIAKSIPVQMALGAGDKFRNQMASLINVATLGKANIPHIKSGEGPGYETGKIGFEILEMMAPATMGSRLLASAGIGALENLENPIRGVGEGLTFGLAGEAAGPAIKGAGSIIRNKLIEPLSLDKKTKEVSEEIRRMFLGAKDKAWGEVGPIMNKHKKDPLITLESREELYKNYFDFEDTFKKDEKLFSSEFRNQKKKFDEDPTIGEAQKLIEKLGIDERRIRYSGDPTKEEKEYLYRNAKEKLRSVVRPRMEELSPGFTKKYDKANLDYAVNVSPFYSSHAVESAAAGNIEELTKLTKGITEEAKKPMRGYPGIGEEHDLLAVNKEIESLLGTSQMFPEGPAKFIPIFGTRLSREKAYEMGTQGVDFITPTLRALIQSQNAPGTSAIKSNQEPLTIEIIKRAQ
jgi:hypothetical protein